MARAKARTTAPARSPDQRLEALVKANTIRAQRARLKKDLAGGRVQITEVLANPPEFAETERVSVLLLAVPTYGNSRVSRLLARCRISESKRLAGLTDRQRQALIEHFQH
jgi:hypothetical protein